LRNIKKVFGYKLYVVRVIMLQAFCSELKEMFID
jgi:hypothetical protein